MAALAPVAPRVFKRILELSGYEAVAEDSYSWVLICNDHAAVVPKQGDAVALDAMHSVLDAAQINNATFFELLEQAKKDLGF